MPGHSQLMSQQSGSRKAVRHSCQPSPRDLRLGSAREELMFGLFWSLPSRMLDSVSITAYFESHGSGPRCASLLPLHSFSVIASCSKKKMVLLLADGGGFL